MTLSLLLNLYQRIKAHPWTTISMDDGAGNFIYVGYSA
jgi:hypothetical protein